MSKKVTVIIDPDTNEVEYQVEGVQGGKCTNITEVLTRSNQTLDVQHTHEYHNPELLPDFVNSGE